MTEEREFILHYVNGTVAVIQKVNPIQEYCLSLQQALHSAIKKGRITKMNLVGIDFTDVDISRVTFDRCDFSRATLSSDIVNVDVFRNCDFTGVKFE